MSEVPAATADGPVRRKDTWSLKSIVEDVSGRPMADYQDPARPPHPYVKSKFGTSPSAIRAAAESTQVVPRSATEEPFDPVDRVYPPLAGSTARELHGVEHEHHQPTLRAFQREPDPTTPGSRPHSPGPSRRPERIYLHYLLLHIDRLSDTALRYLKHAVDEEIDHRQPPAS